MIFNTLKTTIFLLPFIFFSCIQASLSQDIKSTLAERVTTVTDSVFNKYLYSDKFLPAEGEHIGVQGGVISIISSDSIHMLKGYGFSDINSLIPYDAHQTNVMVASVSKMITATAVMTLIEQGTLDLEESVNTYLPEDLKIKHKFDREIKIKHLLTHSAGFDDNAIFSESRSKETIPSLKDYIRDYQPGIVWEPGVFYNYSNFGFALLAYLVEDQSGIPFHQYVSDSVLKPLEMNDSGFEYSERLLKNLMTRYRWNELEDETGWLLEDISIKYTNRIGAAGFKTTASDMSKLLRMFLNLHDEKPGILKSSTIDMMISPGFVYDKKLDYASGLAWKIDKSTGINIYSHSGDDKGIESKMIVIPDHDFGLFISMNNSDGATIISAIDNAIAQYLKNENYDEALALEASTTTHNSDPLILGQYQYMNDSQYSFEKIIYLFGNGLRVISKGDTDGIKINSTAFVPLGDNLFSQLNQDNKVKFFEYKNAYYLTSGFATYRQLKYWENPNMHLYLLTGAMLLFLSSLIWPVTYLVRVMRKKKNSAYNRLQFYLFLTSFSFLLFFILFALNVESLALKYGIPMYFKLFFILPIIGLLCFAYYIILLLTRHFNIIKSVNIIKKTHTLLVIISILVVGFIFNFYNLIGFHF